jgi:site-specific recombinase XerD
MDGAMSKRKNIVSVGNMLTDTGDRAELPPVLVGHLTPEVRRRVEKFYVSVAELFEVWVARRRSPHTQRAYRQDVECFIGYMGFDWAAESWRMYVVSVKDVQGFREHLIAQEAAPKTLNRRISSLSSLYKFLAATAAELRLPITVPNPAHAQFISRESNDPLHETKALSATRARQLMGMPAGDSLVDARDRAILKFYLYTAARIGAGCRLKVTDFHRDGDEATVRLTEKGGRHRTIGLHFAAAEAIAEYIDRARLADGPLFRPRASSNGAELADRHFNPMGMYHLIMVYLRRLPGATKREILRDGRTVPRCIYTPHSLRATTATLLLGAGVDMRKVQDLLGHRHVTTTQIYDKRRIAVSESASHDVPI